MASVEESDKLENTIEVFLVNCSSFQSFRVKGTYIQCRTRIVKGIYRNWNGTKCTLVDRRRIYLCQEESFFFSSSSYASESTPRHYRAQHVKYILHWWWPILRPPRMDEEDCSGQAEGGSSSVARGALLNISLFVVSIGWYLHSVCYAPFKTMALGH